MIPRDEKRHPEVGTEARAAVLVVEDEVFIRMVIADDLREAGHVVIEASNAPEALDVLRGHGADVRVMLSDVRMPGAMDGIALAREVRLRHPAIKIVLTSGNLPTPDWAEHDGFFLKPYDPAIVSGHIKTLLARRASAPAFRPAANGSFATRPNKVR